MADTNVIYTYKAEPGFLLPVGVPAHDLTQQDIDRMQPSARREVKALAAEGMFFKEAADTSKPLSSMTRAELEAHAETVGVENPADYPNMEALIAAIQEADEKGGES